MAKTNEKIMEKINELNDIRKLATIAKIEEIKPIVGADNIEHARVRGWWVVVKKGEFKVGDRCVYVEVDSIMPDGLPEDKREEWRALNKQLSKVPSDEERLEISKKMVEITKLNTRPEFEFLRAVKFHIKTRRILGEISQGICFPLNILIRNDWEWGLVSVKPDLKDFIPCIRKKNSPIVSGISLEEGTDVTELLGVTQYIAPDPAVMGGDAAGTLSGVGLLISDEERLENLSEKYEELKKYTYYKTEKLEGTSITFYVKDGKFGVCGRTINFKVPDENDPYDKLNTYWKVALKLDIERKMKKMIEERDPGLDSNIAFQGELVGEGIQKNIYGLKGQTVCFYNAFRIDTQEYLSYNVFLKLMKDLGLQTVPILDDNYKLPETAKELLEEADRTTTVFGNNPKQLIEGFVFVAKEEIPATVRITRSSFKRLSFKAKSRTYDINKNK